MNNLQEYEFNTELLGAHEFGSSGEHEEVNELMNVSSEHEFESLLGRIWDGAKKLYNSPQGQAIKRDFIAGAKSFGRQMFPSIGRNLGQYFDGTRGAKYGEQIADAAGKWILGNEMQEAVDYVTVIKNAASYLNNAISRGVTAPPRALVTQAINQAARPVLVQRRTQPTANRFTQNSGKWIRKGNRLVILQGQR